MGNKQANAARNEISQLKGRLSSTQNELSSTQNELSSTRVRLEMVNNQANAARNEISQLKGQLSSTQNKLSSTQNELSSTQNELSSTQNELSSTQNELSSTQNELSSTQNELSSTRLRLEMVNQMVEKLTKENLGRETMINKLLKLGELQEQFYSIKVDAVTSNCNLDASRKEEEELKEQLLNQRKFEEVVEMKLRKVIEIEKQVAFVNEEVLSTKVDLETSKKEEDMLKEQLLGLEKILEEMEMKLNMVMKLEKELEDTMNKVLTTKGEFEVLKREENMLKEQLQSCEIFYQDMDTKLQKVLDLEKQLRFIRAEGLFVKASLEGSRKQEERLKKQLSESERFQQDMGMKLQKIFELENEISSYEAEALSDMASLEYTKKEVDELKEKLSLLEKVQQAVVELKLLQITEFDCNIRL